ncbi:hypothetical protein FRC17_003621 [Serendipita sp. 399]|nr:hypothetical protein FRC17_003621 [Serendipita sp. 399]
MGCGLSTLFGFRFGKRPLNDETTTTTAQVNVANDNNTTTTNVVEPTSTETAQIIPVTTTTTTTEPTVADTLTTTVNPVLSNESETNTTTNKPDESATEQPAAVAAFVRPVPTEPSAILKIPPEVLHLILVMAADTPPDRRKLISVCFDWRRTLVNTSFIWTTLRIVTNHDNDQRFEKFLWNLELQLSRCGSLPLDVFWRTSMDEDQTTRLFRLLASKSPFSRWRTLELGGHDRTTLGYAHTATMGDFQNLESFILHASQPNCLLHLVNHSVTPKLTKFENNYLYMPIAQFNQEMTNVIKYTSKLKLPYFEVGAHFELPENIHEVTLKIPLPLEIIERAMMRSGAKVGQLTFQIADKRKGWDTVRRLFVEPPDFEAKLGTLTRTIEVTRVANGTTTRNENPIVAVVNRNQRWRLCPRLKTLRIELMWAADTVVDPTLWTSYVQRVLEERAGGPLKSVTCVWTNSTEIQCVASD